VTALYILMYVKKVNVMLINMISKKEVWCLLIEPIWKRYIQNYIQRKPGEEYYGGKLSTFSTFRLSVFYLLKRRFGDRTLPLVFETLC
jgi:hypothetical protein